MDNLLLSLENFLVGHHGGFRSLRYADLDNGNMTEINEKDGCLKFTLTKERFVNIVDKDGVVSGGPIDVALHYRFDPVNQDLDVMYVKPADPVFDLEGFVDSFFYDTPDGDEHFQIERKEGHFVLSGRCHGHIGDAASIDDLFEICMISSDAYAATVLEKAAEKSKVEAFCRLEDSKDDYVDVDMSFPLPTLLEIQKLVRSYYEDLFNDAVGEFQLRGNALD